MAEPRIPRPLRVGVHVEFGDAVPGRGILGSGLRDKVLTVGLACGLVTVRLWDGCPPRLSQLHPHPLRLLEPTAARTSPARPTAARNRPGEPRTAQGGGR